MASKDNVEGKAVLKYVLTTYSEELKLAREENKATKLSIDYPSLNTFYKAKFNKDFLQPNFEVVLKYVENRINKNRSERNYINMKLAEVPPNAMLHDLDASYNGELISAKAMIKNITKIYPKLKTVAWECRGCMRMQYIDIEGNTQVTEPSLCPECGGRNFRLLTDSSTYHNVRYAKLEEPLELRSGGNSREFKAYMEDFLASPQHKLKPGDACDILGKFSVERVHPNKADFEFVFNLHNIAPVNDAFEDYRITESDKKKIREMSKDPEIYNKLVDTLMPEIFGYHDVKEGLLLQLFEGARPKDDIYNVDTSDRWTIHILLIGDPGIGKSQIISALKKRAPKILNIAGTSTSQAGLTTSAVKDELTGSWTLEAGAVVLADTGVLCLDEYDKLTKSSQKSLNEPMEQMSVSSAKAGLLQVMSARTSIVACANPKYSRFDRFKASLKDQIDIPESNLSRFDLVFALEDTIEEGKDRTLANNLLNKKKFMSEVEVIDLEMFKKYITYAKMECFPVLSEEAIEHIVDFYVDTRSVAARDESAKPITTRDLKAIERLTIARAKTELRDFATVDDAKEAIRIYSAALATIGLSPETAGVMSEVRNDSMVLVKEAENMIKDMMKNSGMFYDDILINVRHKMKFRCEEFGCDIDDIFNEAKANVEDDF